MPDLQDVYLRVYREPPYEETPADAARFAAELAERRQLPGFGLAVVDEGGAPAGFAYGVAQPVGWWHPKAVAPAPPWLGTPVFYVYELAVLPELRGRGHGRRLLDELLTGRAEPYALLAARRHAPARALYRRWGWTEAGELPGGVIELLALPLGDAPAV